MTNEPGLRMLMEKIKQQAGAFLKVFNVTLGNTPSPQRQANAAAGAEALANYGTEPLQIGNELLITDDIVKSYKNLTNSRGRVVIVDQIPAKESALVKASAFGIQVNVGIREAMQMREAYIISQQEA